MLPDTQREKFCKPDGIDPVRSDESQSTSHLPPNAPGHSSLHEELSKFVKVDQLDVYNAARLLVQRSRSHDVWPETEAFFESISGTVSETTKPPLLFAFTSEETAYAMYLIQLLNRKRNKISAVKIVELPADSNSELSKIGSMWSVEKCYWNDINQEFYVDREWIQKFSTKETLPKSIARGFMMHLLCKISAPPQRIQQFTVRTIRNSRSGYIEMPAEVVTEILRITSDGFDLDRRELSEGITDAELEASTWFDSLGKTHDERQSILNQMKLFKKKS